MATTPKVFPRQSHPHLAESSLLGGKPRCHSDRGCGEGVRVTRAVGGGKAFTQGSREDTRIGKHMRNMWCVCVCEWVWWWKERRWIKCICRNLNKRKKVCTHTHTRQTESLFYKSGNAAVQKERKERAGDRKFNQEANFFVGTGKLGAGPPSWVGPGFSIEHVCFLSHSFPSRIFYSCFILFVQTAARVINIKHELVL